MKSRLMRKLFFSDLLIFLLLLLFELGFQTFLFEPFLVSEQSKRLTQSMIIKLTVYSLHWPMKIPMAYGMEPMKVYSALEISWV